MTTEEKCLEFINHAKNCKFSESDSVDDLIRKHNTFVSEFNCLVDDLKSLSQDEINGVNNLLHEINQYTFRIRSVGRTVFNEVEDTKELIKGNYTEFSNILYPPEPAETLHQRVSVAKLIYSDSDEIDPEANIEFFTPLIEEYNGAIICGVDKRDVNDFKADYIRLSSIKRVLELKGIELPEIDNSLMDV